ncbi:GNAT family N-acetyltransferase [Moraxella sp. ZJ142]|uniref:GNAT family N-acetyltransferase n=1 Tax=Moraxella marmotae TaxID=3344520 RepID=UPI0035D3FD89
MQIIHNTAEQRFETTIDGITAYLSYQVLDEQTLDYDHTIVPSALGGRGLGSLLVRHALDYAQDNGKKVLPSCSFVANYIQRRPEYQPLLATDAPE